MDDSIDLRASLISLAEINPSAHPVFAVKALGIIYDRCEGIPIGDCFIFYFCRNLLLELPHWLKVIDRTGS